MPTFRQVIYIEAPIQKVFDFHLDLNNLLKISPPDFQVQIYHAPQKLEKGSKIGLFVKTGLVTTTMDTIIEELDPPYKLVDRQTRGFFSEWVHTHLFDEITGNKTKLTENIQYSLPLGALGNLFGGGIARGHIERIFSHRAIMTKRLLEDAHTE